MMVMIQLFSWQLWLLMMIHIDFMIFPIRPWDPWDCLQSQVAGQVEIGRPAVRLEASSRRQTCGRFILDTEGIWKTPG